MRILISALVLSLIPAIAPADDPPEIDFQPPSCTVPGKAISLCAFISDDNQIGAARVHFKRPKDKYFYYVDMIFGGINYCATLPAPSEKAKKIEYYLKATDTPEYQMMRTSTYQLNVQPEGVCGFPPVEKDADKAASITVHAMHKKQGKKLPKEFVSTGVTYVAKQR
jgi:hypothetical protein